jgi:hypothetical protein
VIEQPLDRPAGCPRECGPGRSSRRARRRRRSKPPRRPRGPPGRGRRSADRAVGLDVGVNRPVDRRAPRRTQWSPGTEPQKAWSSGRAMPRTRGSTVRQVIRADGALGRRIPGVLGHGTPDTSTAASRGTSRTGR